MIFPTRVNGIPCQCRVTYFSPAVPMRVYGPGMGDADPPEPEVLDFEILDRRGRPAPWLTRYVTPEVMSRITEEHHIMAEGEYYEAFDA